MTGIRRGALWGAALASLAAVLLVGAVVAAWLLPFGVVKTQPITAEGPDAGPVKAIALTIDQHADVDIQAGDVTLPAAKLQGRGKWWTPTATFARRSATVALEVGCAPAPPPVPAPLDAALLAAGWCRTTAVVVVPRDVEVRVQVAPGGSFAAGRGVRVVEVASQPIDVQPTPVPSAPATPTPTP